VGFLAFPRHRELLLKLAAVLGVTPFLWGAAGGHIYQMVANGDHAAGNAGTILWTDLLLPALGLAAVWAHHRALARASAPGGHRRVVREPAEPVAPDPRPPARRLRACPAPPRRAKRLPAAS
jgi:hypothetical protein